MNSKLIRQLQKLAIAPSEQARQDANKRQLQLTKPAGSLGRLEDIAINFCGYQNTQQPQLQNISIVVFAADHGIALAHPVSAFPSVVTAQMVANFCRQGAAISVLSNICNAKMQIVSLGTVGVIPKLDCGHLIIKNIAQATADFSVESAMTDWQLQQSIDAGIQQIEQLPTDTQLFIGGEMGIGNSSSASALTSVLLGVSVEQCCGRGTGVDDSNLALKTKLIKQAIQRHQCAIDSADNSAWEALRRLGGMELAALAASYIGAAQRAIPVLVDGFISSSAAMVAVMLNPSIKPWLLYSHRSAEQGHAHIIQYLAAQPLIDFNMRLGEGSGAALCVPLLQAACRLHSEMATFEQASVSDKKN